MIKINQNTSTTTFESLRLSGKGRLNHISGFTLLELMVSIALGLLIVAAGIAVFLSGQRSLGLQGGMDELQQNANFGLAMLTHDLRHANLNTPSTQKINNKQVGSGIIFSTSNLPSSLATVSTNFFTQQDKDNDATTGKSDQLTIQYIPEYLQVTQKQCKPDTADEDGNCSESDKEDVAHYKTKGMDCEGNSIDFTEPRVLVQRYYLKADSSQVTGQPTAYSLYCDAGSYVAGDPTITGITNSSNGQQIMQRIDAFKVRLGVKAPDGKLRYMTIAQYLASMPATVTDEKNYNNIVSAEIGILARSTTSLNSESLIDNTKTFDLVGNTITLSTVQQAGVKFLRENFSQIVAFRNTLGASE